MQEFINALNEAKQQIDTCNNNFIGLFLYGSQNYGLSHKNFDYDFICLVIDTDNGMPFNIVRYKYSQIKIYNLGILRNYLVKGDLECLEILTTEYNYLNPVYEDIVKDLCKSIDAFTSDDKVKEALSKKLKEHIEYLEYITKKELGFFYNKKRLYWAIRVKEQLQQMLAGKSFTESLHCPERLVEELLSIKTGKTCITKQEYKNKKDELYSFIMALPDFKCLDNPDKFIVIRNFIYNIRSKECTLV